MISATLFVSELIVIIFLTFHFRITATKELARRIHIDSEES